MRTFGETASSTGSWIRQDDEEPLVELEGCEDYIAEFIGTKMLRLVDKRQVKLKEEHEERLKKELAKRRSLLRYRITDLPTDKLCDAMYVNNTHFFYGDGSRLGHNHRDNHYALDFPLNTRLNRTEFTKHLQNLEVRYSNVTKEWLASAIKLAKPRSVQRSRSSPNVRFKTESFNRCEFQEKRGQTVNFPVYNVDNNFKIPDCCDFDCPIFSKKLTTAMSDLAENINPPKMKTGWQSISSILFSTFDNHFYAVIDPLPKYLHEFSRNFSNILKRYHVRPQQNRNDWQRKNVILHLFEYSNEGTMFRRARHICTRGIDDYFIEMDTGNLRVIRNAGMREVMRLPADQANHPSAIIQCRFRNTKMTQEEMSLEIERIRADKKIFIVDFDEQSEATAYKRCSGLNKRNKSQHEKSSILTAVIITAAAKPHKCRMTTAFCGEINCMGCWTWRAFKKPVVIAPMSPQPVLNLWGVLDDWEEE